MAAGAVWGHRLPVLVGDLVRAVRHEAAVDVAEAWRVDVNTVTKWRKALRVKVTKGTALRLSDSIKATDPARAEKIASAKLGKPRPPHVMAKLRKANAGRPLSKAHRAKLSEVRKRLGIRPPRLQPAWAAPDDKLVRMLLPPEVVKRTGRTLQAVYTWRTALGINKGRTTRHKRTGGRRDNSSRQPKGRTGLVLRELCEAWCNEQ